jgi:type II secretory pathway component PulF
VGNEYFSEVMTDAHDYVATAGLGLSTYLTQKPGFFPAVVPSMLAIGEDSGKFYEMSMKLSDYFDSEIDGTLENMTSLLEPVILMFLGAVTCLIMMATFLPLYTMLMQMKT